MPLYQAIFGYVRPEKVESGVFDPQDLRCVTYRADEPSPELAYTELFRLPRIKGGPENWKIISMVRCLPPLKRDKRDLNPYYLELSRRILDKILSGEYKPGDRMPGRVVWAQQLGAENSTDLRKALAPLEGAGFISVATNGTFIRDRKNWDIPRIEMELNI